MPLRGICKTAPVSWTGTGPEEVRHCELWDPVVPCKRNTACLSIEIQIFLVVTNSYTVRDVNSSA